MKVGEAGEAFFVVETDAEVPEELQTSPVMSATQVSRFLITFRLTAKLRRN
jgi:phosphatidate phosphatase PAH1